MDLKRLKEKKEELGFTNQKVADISGVPLGTVQKIFGNTTSKPRLETYMALVRALDPMAEEHLGGGASRVGEAEAAYDLNYSWDRQGEYTIDDYYALPDDKRVELIDGVIYDMDAPTIFHQVIVGEIYYQLSNCADEHELECLPMVSPLDVQLDRDNRTMVQPDVLIICDMSMVRERVVYGAPEFVLEVISPSTRNKDCFTKLNKYSNAGCQEVWIVDPKTRKVWTYEFREDDWIKTYTFDDVVPVAISDGKCSIDFTKVAKKLDRFVSVKNEK